ncbi:MAG TPA: nuclear transport factor 2 family protein [Puia sp.]|nr:nuclear transport factor 2 family protein [Puia sp.]
MRYFYLFACIAFCNVVKAQSPEDSVKAAVNQLFTAMKNADSSLLVSSFADSALLQTIVTTKEGKVEVKNESIIEFASFINKTPKGDADERIVFDILKIDGALATVWAPYKFYYKGKFNHCGVDSFQMLRVNGKWKIQYLIDTRRKQGCE